jgi:hypothetical protein
MLQDIDYDLMETITIISKSLYRYEALMQDADKCKCENCVKIWKMFRENREKELEVLLAELKTHTFTWAP